MKRIFYIALSLLLLFAVFQQDSFSETLRIVHFNVGKGEATLVISPSGSTILIDAGTETEDPDIIAEMIADFLIAEGIESLTYTLATHFHLDHISAFTPLFEDHGFLPEIAFDRGAPGVDPAWTNCSSYREYINVVENHAVRDSILAGDIINLGSGVILTVIYSNGKFINSRTDNLLYQHSTENIRSTTILLEYHNFSYVIGGDLTGVGTVYSDKETPVAGLIGDIDVFQVNHHGGNSSTNQNWLDVLRPEVGIVSASALMVKQDVVDRIDECPTMETLYHTDDSNIQGLKSVIVGGDIFLETDGLTFYVVDGDSFSIDPQPAISVKLMSDTMYVAVPSNGGSFDCVAGLVNNTPEPVSFDLWSVRHHDGRWSLAYPAEEITLPPYGTNIETITYSLSADRDFGNHTYEIRAGSFPDIIWDSKCFPVWKDSIASIEHPPVEDLVDFGSIPKNEESNFNSYPSSSICPNPFNPQTTISFSLEQSSHVNIAVYDVSGRLLNELAEGWFPEGKHEITFDGRHLPSGIYFYRFQTGDFVISKKIVLLK